MTLVNVVDICGVQSEEIQPGFNVICTQSPNHEGDHKTIFSVHGGTKKGFEYVWKNEMAS
jgi:hypothetical protein